jgi:hypothetical protein
MSVRRHSLATTLILLAVGLGYGVSQWQARPPMPRPPARTAPVPARPASPPTAPEMLERTEELQLTPTQVTRLTRLAREWAAEAAQLEGAIEEAAAKFEEFAAAAKSGGGASLQEIQRRSADLQGLSAELRDRRVAHSRRIVDLLTDAQRAKLGAESLHSPGGRA